MLLWENTQKREGSYASLLAWQESSFVNPKVSFGSVTFFLFALLLVAVCFWVQRSASALYFGDTITITKTGQPSLSSKIDTTENGSVYVVWADKNRVYLRASYDNGTKFGPTNTLSDNNSIATSPQIAATENGNVYVVWVNKNSTSGDTDIAFVSAYKGENFSKTKALSTTDTQLLSSSSPQIAATENGNVYVVWVNENSTSGDTDIVFRASTTSGEKFTRKVLSRDASPSSLSLALSPQIAATENGNVYVGWIDKNTVNGDSTILFDTSSSGGENFTTKRIDDFDGDLALPSMSPKIAASELGDIYAAWVGTVTQFIEMVEDPYIRDETVLLSNRPSVSTSPQIAATENGNVYVVWADKNSRGGDYELQFKRISKSLFI